MHEVLPRDPTVNELLNRLLRTKISGTELRIGTVLWLSSAPQEAGEVLLLASEGYPILIRGERW